MTQPGAVGALCSTKMDSNETVQAKVTRNCSISVVNDEPRVNEWIDSLEGRTVVGLSLIWGKERTDENMPQRSDSEESEGGELEETQSSGEEQDFTIAAFITVGVPGNVMIVALHDLLPEIPQKLLWLLTTPDIAKAMCGLNATALRRLLKMGFSPAHYVDVGDLERRHNKEAPKKDVVALAQDYFGQPFGDNHHDLFWDLEQPLTQDVKTWIASCSLVCVEFFAAHDSRLTPMLKRAALPCPVRECERYFASNKALEHHKQIHHHDPSMPHSHPHKCQHCTKFFRSMCALVQHVEVAHPEQPLPRQGCTVPGAIVEGAAPQPAEVSSLVDYELPCCGNCEATFQTSSELEQHHRQAGHDKKWFACKCSKRFKSRSALEMHYDVTHANSGENTCSCSFCGREFTSLDALYQHQQCVGHSLPEICVVCSASFERLSELEDHYEKTNHNNYWLCGVCPKKFAEKDALLKHETSTKHTKGFLASEAPMDYMKRLRNGTGRPDRNGRCRNGLPSVNGMGPKPKPGLTERRPHNGQMALKTVLQIRRPPLSEATAGGVNPVPPVEHTSGFNYVVGGNLYQLSSPAGIAGNAAAGYAPMNTSPHPPPYYGYQQQQHLPIEGNLNIAPYGQSPSPTTSSPNPFKPGVVDPAVISALPSHTHTIGGASGGVGPASQSSTPSTDLGTVTPSSFTAVYNHSGPPTPSSQQHIPQGRHSPTNASTQQVNNLLRGLPDNGSGSSTPVDSTPYYAHQGSTGQGGGGRATPSSAGPRAFMSIAQAESHGQQGNFFPPPVHNPQPVHMPTGGGHHHHPHHHQPSTPTAVYNDDAEIEWHTNTNNYGYHLHHHPTDVYTVNVDASALYPTGTAPIEQGQHGVHQHHHGKVSPHSYSQSPPPPTHTAHGGQHGYFPTTSPSREEFFGQPPYTSGTYLTAQTLEQHGGYGAAHSNGGQFIPPQTPQHHSTPHQHNYIGGHSPSPEVPFQGEDGFPVSPAGIMEAWSSVTAPCEASPPPVPPYFSFGCSPSQFILPPSSTCKSNNSPHKGLMGSAPSTPLHFSTPTPHRHTSQDYSAQYGPSSGSGTPVSTGSRPPSRLQEDSPSPVGTSSPTMHQPYK